MAKNSALSAAAEDVKRIVEALVFASDEPLSAKQVRTLIEGEPKQKKRRAAATGELGESLPVPAAPEAPEPPAGEDSAEAALPAREPADPADGESAALNARAIRAAIVSLNEEYERDARPFHIVEIAGGFQFATRKEYGAYVGRLAKEKSRRRLSHAALEVLAIAAYRQPVTKPEIEAIRGVGCDEVLQSLLEKNLVAITGRANSVGRPLLFGTTDAFLKYFGLADLKDLPRQREIDELLESQAALPEQMILEIPAEENAQEIEDHLAPLHHDAPHDEPVAARGAAPEPDAPAKPFETE